MEVKRAVALECGVGAPDLIDLRDERSETRACVAVPVTNLVLLAVEILFTTGFGGKIFAQFIGRAVDAVVRAKCCRKDQALHEGRAAAVLKGGMQDVGRVWPEIRMKEVATGGLVISSKYSRSSSFVLRQVKYV